MSKKDSLWIVVLVTTVFTAYSMGYSIAPMVQVGMIGGKGDGKIGIESEVNEELEEYYRSLSEDSGTQ